MAESGRFEELSNILGRVYGSVPRAALQTLVFSATLTLPPGKHTLELLFADYQHLSYDPALHSAKITSTVE